MQSHHVDVKEAYTRQHRTARQRYTSAVFCSNNSNNSASMHQTLLESKRQLSRRDMLLLL